MGDKPGAGAYETVAAAKDGEILLSFGQAVTQRGKQRGVETADPGQILGVHPVRLVLVLVDEPELARVSDKDLVTEIGKEPAHPGRVGACFKHDAQRLACGEAPLESRWFVGQA